MYGEISDNLDANLLKKLAEEFIQIPEIRALTDKKLMADYCDGEGTTPEEDAYIQQKWREFVKERLEGGS